MPIRDVIKTVVLVMMENRSFDHMLGHLSNERIKPVDGLKSPFRNFANLYNGDEYPPFSMKDRYLDSDPPHEAAEVDEQLAYSDVTQQFTMKGFVESYANAIGNDPGIRALPMGFFPSAQVPITSFLASNYAVCDRWFSSLPTSTQPNRAMAFTGDSTTFETPGGLHFIPVKDIVFDWLDRANVRWKVYHDGLSFFILFENQLGRVLGANFDDYESLGRDLLQPVSPSDPQVIIVEPSYQAAPHIGSDRPNDNHAPLAVGAGEEFVRRTYDSVRANPERWASTVMILYYDEHGGFADHVPPPSIAYETTGATTHPFASMGPRVPAIVISPLVEQDAICSEIMDHTSVLQLLAELFTPGTPYSATVEARRKAGVVSASVAITRTAPRTDTLPAPSVPIAVNVVLGASLVDAPDKAAASFENAALQMLQKEPQATAAKYPELLQWKEAVQRLRAAQPG